MCINFETSIASLTIGVVSGCILLRRRQMIGFFIIFYTLIQLWEALIYHNPKNSVLLSRLLLISLGSQGLVAAACLPSVPLWIWSMFGLIAGYIIVHTLSNKDFRGAQITGIMCSSCNMRWPFIHTKIRSLLVLMYALIFYILFRTPPRSIPHKCGWLFLITLIVSMISPNSIMNPSVWCLASSIAAPIVLFVRP